MKAVVAYFRRVYSKKHLFTVYEKSVTEKNGHTFFLVREGMEKKLVIISQCSGQYLDKGFEVAEEGEFKFKDKTYVFTVCPCNHGNASVLRRMFSFICPQPAGLKAAIGMGDRVGLATPGHARAARGRVFPVLAQQSVRELSRTLRTFDDVLDDVSWAVFQEGFQDGFGADADHLKALEDVDKAVDAGYTMFTVDPSEYVDNDVERYKPEELIVKFQALPWMDLGCEPEAFSALYLGEKVNIEDETLEITEELLFRMAVKYSAAIAYAARVFRRIEASLGRVSFDFEMSVDETEFPTSPLEHVFIALELRRLGVKFTGLALRFEGRFEKAVDYVGDLAKFGETFRKHMSVAKNLGPYKLSVHSGSDKFSVFPVMGKYASDMLHLKTSGTSYLEALRIVARHEPSLFREIVKYGIERFGNDRKAYDVTTDLSVVPDPFMVSDSSLERTYLDENNGRQLLHITYGSVLTAKRPDGELVFRQRIFRCLLEHEEEHYETVAEHLRRHIEAVWSSSKKGKS